jgi:hypothetical protein
MKSIIIGEVMANYDITGSRRTKTKKGPVEHKVLSDRGVHLEQCSFRQQCSSIGFGRKITVGQDGNGDDIVVTQGQKCPKCRMKVRGPNHAEGHHHRGIAIPCGQN